MDKVHHFWYLATLLLKVRTTWSILGWMSQEGHSEPLFSGKNTAQQVLMSVCQSVRVCDNSSPRILQNAWRMFHNVPECMQNVHEYSRMHAKCSRMLQNACRMFQNIPECMQNAPECLRMNEECSRTHAKCSRIFHNACRSMSLHAGPWACMQLHKLACFYISLHAVTWPYMQFNELSWSSMS